MLNGVKYEGLAAGPVTIQGPDGPVTISPEERRPLAVFGLDGWDPAGPEAEEDEAQGNRVAQLMEAAGDALADGLVSPEEAVRIAEALDPHLPGLALAADALPLVEGLFRRIGDDGRLSRAEGVSLALEVLQTLARRLLRSG